MAEAVDKTLESLAAVAIKEHEACIAAAHTTIDHAVAAGAALLLVRDRLEGTGQWLGWLEKSWPASRGTAHKYMRLSSYKRLLPEGAGITEADQILRSLPTIDGGPGRPRIEDGRKVKARELREEDVPYKVIAKEIGASPSTVHAWFEPTKKKREREAGYIAREERREERLREALRGDTRLAEAYELAERLIDVIGEVRREHEGKDLDAALELQRAARDRIVRGLGIDD